MSVQKLRQYRMTGRAVVTWDRFQGTIRGLAIVVGATLSFRVILIPGLANLLSNSLLMAASGCGGSDQRKSRSCVYGCLGT